MKQELTIEDVLWDRPDLLASMPPCIRQACKPKPKPVVAPIPVSEKLAAAAKANPESVKVRVSAEVEVVVVLDPPRRGVIVEEVREIAERRAGARAERERIEKEAWSYRPAGRVVHTYNPLNRMEE